MIADTEATPPPAPPIPLAFKEFGPAAVSVDSFPPPGADEVGFATEVGSERTWGVGGAVVEEPPRGLSSPPLGAPALAPPSPLLLVTLMLRCIVEAVVDDEAAGGIDDAWGLVAT